MKNFCTKKNKLVSAQVFNTCEDCDGTCETIKQIHEKEKTSTASYDEAMEDMVDSYHENYL